MSIRSTFFTFIIFSLLTPFVATAQIIVPDSLQKQFTTKSATTVKAEHDNLAKTPQYNSSNTEFSKATTPSARKLARTKTIGRLTNYMSFYAGYGFPANSGINNSNRYTQYSAGLEAIYYLTKNWDVGIGVHYLHASGYAYENMEEVDVSKNYMGINIPARCFPMGKLFYVELRPEITWQRVRRDDWEVSDEYESKYDFNDTEFGCPLGVGFEIPVSRTIFFLVAGHYNPVRSTNSAYSAVPFSLTASVCINIE